MKDENRFCFKSRVLFCTALLLLTSMVWTPSTQAHDGGEHPQPLDLFLPLINNETPALQQNLPEQVDVDEPRVDEEAPGPNDEAENENQAEEFIIGVTPNGRANAAALQVQDDGTTIPSKCISQANYFYEQSTANLDQVALDTTPLATNFATASERVTTYFLDYDGLTTDGNDFYIYDASTGAILRLNANGIHKPNYDIVAQWSGGSPIRNHKGIAFDGTHFYLYNSNNGWVRRVNEDGSWAGNKGIATNADESPLTGYEGFGYEDGYFFVYDAETAKVHRLNSDLQLIDTNYATIQDADGVNATGQAGLAAAGLLYVYNPADAKIIGTAQDGEFATNRGTASAYEAGSILNDIVAIATSDHYIYSYSSNGYVRRLSRTSGFREGGFWARDANNAKFTDMEGLAFDGVYFYLYDAETAKVYQLNNNGTFRTTFGNGTSQTHYVILKWANGENANNLTDIATDGAYFYSYTASSGNVHRYKMNGAHDKFLGTFPNAGREGFAVDSLHCRTLSPNLVIGKQVEQSSTGWQGSAPRAIDNMYGGMYWQNESVSQTLNENQPWWQVDLNGTYHLDKISIWNRQDAHSARLSNFYVLVTNEDMRGRTLNQLLNDPDVWSYHQVDAVDVNLEIASNSFGRFVRIQKADSNSYLGLAEVEVYGKNLALNRPATQSSTDGSVAGSANHAVDGSTDTASQTNEQIDPWWQVDLERNITIGRIEIRNSASLGLYHVFVSTSDMSGRSLDALLNDDTVWHYWDRAWNGDRRIAFGPATGRYVRIVVEDEGFIGLNEIIVSGVATWRSNGDSNPNPAVYGNWAPPMEWPTVAIHASLDPSGNLITWDSAPDDFDTDPHTNNSLETNAYIWDYRTNTHTAVYPNTESNLFCSAHAHLENGDMFTAGGDIDSYRSIDASNIYHYKTQTWSRVASMSYARWYPSVAVLNSGEMLVSGGRSAEIEIYTPETDAYRTLTGATFTGQAWPWLQQAPNGKVVYAGPSQTIHHIDTSGAGTLTVKNVRDEHNRGYGNYNVYDIGKILVMGGRGTDGTANIVDMDSGTSTDTGSMAYDRMQSEGVVLPDGSVLALGGHSGTEYLCDLIRPVFAAELWSPDTGEWTTMDAQHRPRQYHSTALLLPDGRVWAGGDTCSSEPNAEIFNPPYLYNADGSLASRPTISSAPETVLYDVSFDLTTQQAANIQSVSLVRLGSVTHSTNFEQRRVPLNFTRSGNTLTLTSPENSNIAPPGYYMLFIIDGNGVPSVSHMLQVVRDEFQWQQTNGGATHTSYGVDGSAWAIGWNGLSIWRRQDATNGTWQQMSPPVGLVQVDALNYDNAVGVSADDRIYFYDGGSWNQISGRLKHVSYGTDGSMWGVNASNAVYRRQTTSSGWQQMSPPSGLVQIDALDYDNAVGVAEDDTIYFYNGSTWTAISGRLKHVSYGKDGSMWGVNENNWVYRRPRSTPGSWQRMALPVDGLKQVDGLDYSHAIGVTPDSAIYYFDEVIWDNTAPTINNPGNQSGTVGDSVNLTVSGNDVDGDTLTFSASGLPTGLSINNNGTISGQPTAVGSFTVSVSVSDGNGDSDSASFTWTVEEPPTQSMVPVYDDALQNGWRNWSWAASINLSSATEVYAGTTAIAASLNAYGALSLNKLTPADVDQYEGFGFWIHGGSGGQNLVLDIRDSTGTRFGTNLPVPTTAGEWTYHEFAFAALGEMDDLVRLTIKNRASNAAPLFYVDEIVLLSDASAPPPPPPSASTMLYDDLLRNDWQDYSWADVDFGVTSPVQEGSNAISINAERWKALYLFHATPVDMSQYESVGFWVHGGSGGNQRIALKAVDGIGNRTSYEIITPTANTWTYHEVPFSAFGSPSDIKGLIWQNWSGSTIPEYFVDNIVFIDSAAAAAANTSVVGSGSGAIEGQVWYDLNQDGKQTAGEIALADMLMVLVDLGANGVLDGTDTIVARQHTDENGRYAFSELAEGKYLLSVGSLDPRQIQPNQFQMKRVLLASGQRLEAQTMGLYSGDLDGDRISDLSEGDGDLDKDGLPNYADIDSDGDGNHDITDPNSHDADSRPEQVDTDAHRIFLPLLLR